MPDSSQTLPDAIVTHIMDLMNNGCQPALIRIAQTLGNCPHAKDATLVGIDLKGVCLSSSTEKGAETCYIDFEEPIREPSDVHRALNLLDEKARKIKGEQTN